MEISTLNPSLYLPNITRKPALCCEFSRYCSLPSLFGDEFESRYKSWVAENVCELQGTELPSLQKCGSIGFRRQRLDEVCVERFPQYSRSMIQSWILQGKVLVDGRVASKAGMAVTDKAIVEITAETPKYV